MSLASIAVLMSCLVVMGSFALLIMNIDVNLDKLRLLNQVVVFIDESKTDAEVEEIGEKIKALDNVSNVEFTSKEQALEDEKAKNPDYAELYDVVEGDNPLRDSYVITYADNSKVSTLVFHLGTIDGVAKISNRLDLAVSIEKVKSGVSTVLIWFMLILFVVTIFVIINTIKLAVHNRRAEITIMRYIGATNWFVVLPFIFEGIIIGLISGGLAYFIQWYLYGYVVSMMSDSLSIVTIVDFSTISFKLLLSFLGIGVVTGIIGSTISTSKQLRA